MNDAVTLPARLDVTTVGDVAITLRRAADVGSVRVDASDVTHMGALGVQLLLSTARSLRDKNAKLEIFGIGERAQQQLDAMGFTPEMLVEGLT